jgi:starvation-inducible outer membrane lipoprotein
MGRIDKNSQSMCTNARVGGTLGQILGNYRMRKKLGIVNLPIKPLTQPIRDVFFLIEKPFFESPQV